MATPRFVLPGSNPGLIVRGNIDINNRTIVHIGGGKIATVRSVSFGIQRNGKIVHVLVPSVVGGQVISDDAAFRHFQRSGAHLGMFNTPANATSYAKRLHQYQARIYGPKKVRSG